MQKEKVIVMKNRAISRIMIIAVALVLIIPTPEVFAASAKVKVTGGNAPTTLVQGKDFKVKGKIKSNKKIKRVEIGVTTKGGGKWTAQKYDKKNLNVKSFNISKANGKLKFHKLKAGTYIYRVYVHTSDKKVKTVINKKFTVKKKSVATVSNNAPSTTTTSSSENGVTLSNYNVPSTYQVGKTLNVKGTISAKENIKRVEIGIVFEPTNKWTSYKYDINLVIPSKTFNIADAASKLRFDKIPGGKYRYRIYVHTASGVKIALNHGFEVKPSGKPLAAANWAVKIANDNSFTYGKVPATSRPGCYFCGTNQKKKPKGYEKTYVCITFAGAAYAHGAKDAEILKQCKSGKMTMYENNDNFSKFGCWMKIGSCSELQVSDLQVGDVLIKWDNNNSTGHACIYAGGNKLVEAATPGFTAKSIKVSESAASRLKSLSSNKKNYVMRYIY